MTGTRESITTSARVLFVVGTRPEAIKLAPVIRACQAFADQVEPVVCFTGQHREMLSQVASHFEIEADVDLAVMQSDQSLAGLTGRCLEGLDAVLVKYRPDYVVAQGDTTTVLAASLAAFYRQTKFVHVEAGLRTGNLEAPWPEEFNRRVASISARLHCAPTQWAADNLRAEGVSPDRIEVTGNTVIDALLWTLERERRSDAPWPAQYAGMGERRLVLVTGHRRESFGAGFESICRAIAELANEFAELHFLYPVHLNPNVREPVQRLLGGLANVQLVEPVPYPEFVWLMDRSTLILTDSGGVQEEAPTLQKPVLVMRETTERPEGVQAGAVRLVGTSVDGIVNQARLLLTDPLQYSRCIVEENPYGDGQAATRILNWICRDWESSQR